MREGNLCSGSMLEKSLKGGFYAHMLLSLQSGMESFCFGRMKKWEGNRD